MTTLDDEEKALFLRVIRWGMSASHPALRSGTMRPGRVNPYKAQGAMAYKFKAELHQIVHEYCRRFTQPHRRWIKMIGDFAARRPFLSLEIWASMKAAKARREKSPDAETLRQSALKVMLDSIRFTAGKNLIQLGVPREMLEAAMSDPDIMRRLTEFANELARPKRSAPKNVTKTKETQCEW